MALYPSFLGLCVSPSNSGKTTFVLEELATLLPEERLWVYTFDRDPQFASAQALKKLTVCSYDDLKVADIPPRTFIVFDEFNDAMSKDSTLIDKVENIFTTRAHHHQVSAICILQSILKTPAYRLLRLCHALMLQTQQQANAQLLKHVPMYRHAARAVELFLQSQDHRPLFVTIYINPPFRYNLLLGVVGLRKGLVRALLSLNKNRKMNTLASTAEEVLRPLLEKGYDNGLAIVPMDQIVLSKPSTGNEDGSTDDSAKWDALDNTVHQMILNTASPKQKFQFNSLWWFIRHNKGLYIDPATLLLHTKNGKHTMGLQPFLSLLVYPSQLSSSKRKSRPFSQSAVVLTATLMNSPLFNPAKVINAKLKMAAYRWLNSSSGLKK